MSALVEILMGFLEILSPFPRASRWTGLLLVALGAALLFSASRTESVNSAALLGILATTCLATAVWGAWVPSRARLILILAAGINLAAVVRLAELILSAGSA